MLITWSEIISLLPLLIIGLTVVIIMLSVSYCRSQLRHVILTILGLSIVVIVLFSIVWRYQSIQNINQLIYIDNTSLLHMTLLIISSYASSLSAYTWLLRYPNNYRDEFYLLLLISSMGGILLTIANHLVILFLGIELISLPLLGLINFSFLKKSAIATSIKYLILSGISSAFLLFGIALVYAKTGCLSFFDIKATLLSCHTDDQDSFQFILLMMTGLLMMMIGFGFKLSSVPFHSWAPDVYQIAPSVVSMYLATGSKIAVISVLMRFLLVLPEQYYKFLYVFLSISACCSMLFGSIVAIQQNNIKRILAYSSITSSGYLLVVLIVSNIDYVMSQEAMGIYLINYLFSNIGAFGIISLISKSYNSSIYEKINNPLLSLYRGLFWRAPVLSVAFTIVILSLAGIPMTLGFIGKFYLLLIGINNHLWVLSSFILFSSIISIFYYLKMIINLYLSPIKYVCFNHNDAFEISLYNPTGVMVLVISFGIIIFGLYPQPIIGLINSICVH